MLRILVLVAALVLAPAAASAAAPPTQEAHFNRLLGELSNYAQPHQTALTEASNLVVLTIDGMSKAQALSEAHAGRQRVTREMDAWETALRASIDGLKARRDQLPAFPQQTFRDLVAMSPGLKGMDVAYRQVEAESRKSIEAAITFAERTIGPARLAAAGDQEAMTDLAVEMITGLKLVLISENAMLDITIASNQPKHPQTALARSIRASNAGIELYFDYEVAGLTGDHMDPKETAGKIRARVAESRQASSEIVRLASAMKAGLRVSGAPPAIIERLSRMLDTYKESSEAELALADTLERVAALIEQGEDSAEKLDAAIAPLDAAVERRTALQALRIELIKP